MRLRPDRCGRCGGHKNFYQGVYAWVRAIPPGQVMTYGQVATYLGSPRAARAVGYALMHLTEPCVPWHRVVNASGGISVGGRVDRPTQQLRRLRREGITFDKDERLSLARYRWVPDGSGASGQLFQPSVSPPG